jgi:hypothetical protein
MIPQLLFMLQKTTVMASGANNPKKQSRFKNIIQEVANKQAPHPPK